MPRSPASVPDLSISSRSSLPKEGVSFLVSSSRAPCRAIRVASEIRPLVLMMIGFITIKSSLVPLIEGLCAQI